MHRSVLSPFRIVTVILAMACAGLSAAGMAQGIQKQPLPSEIYLYQGADREQRLIEGAKKEGKVVLYTSLNTKDSAPIAEAFEKKYAAQNIKVTLWRASGQKVVQRALTEAYAGRFTPDVFESDSVEMEALAREKLLTPFSSPAFKELPPAAFPAHRMYVADRFNFFTIAYNTNLVKPEEVPSTYQDLLLPKWAGKIGMEAGDQDWFAAVTKSMGEKEGLAYFSKLAASHPQLRTGHTLLAELVAAGEVPIAAALYNHAVERLAKSGAPIKWKALAPTMGRAGGVAVSAKAPHPHAALLFADFILSREGQELIKKRNRVPASTAIETPLNKFPFQVIDPAIVLDESAKWEKLWSTMFLNGRAVEHKEE